MNYFGHKQILAMSKKSLILLLAYADHSIRLYMSVMLNYTYYWVSREIHHYAALGMRDFVLLDIFILTLEDLMKLLTARRLPMKGNMLT